MLITSAPSLGEGKLSCKTGRHYVQNAINAKVRTMTQINLRPWQAQAVQRAITWLTLTRTDRHFLINAAPGAGKTICASVIAARLLELHEIERVIVIAPRSEVVRQWSEEFKTVTGRAMTKVTGAHAEIEDYGTDL